MPIIYSVILTMACVLTQCLCCEAEIPCPFIQIEEEYLRGTAPHASFWTVFAFFSKTTTHW